jgi:hypothetical protein
MYVLKLFHALLCTRQRPQLMLRLDCCSTESLGLLSNIIDTGTDSTPPPLKQFVILERCGLKIGIVGLVEACVDPSRSHSLPA